MEPVKECIVQFMEQFKKDWQKYEDHCHRMAQKVEGLLKQKGIMGIVTYRTKDPERLQEKLIKRDLEGKNYQTPEDIARDITDLVGIRVALYFPGDAQKIAATLTPQFEVVKTKEFPAPVEEFDAYRDQGFTAYKRRVYPGYDERRFDGYCAIHHHIREADSTDNFNPIIEIQVASLLMHAWSEVEHDLAYKNKMGKVSREEYEVLDEINGLVLAGEIALRRLDQLSRQRIEQENSPLASHYILQTYLDKWQEDHGQGGRALGNVETLFKLYQKKNMLSRSQVDAELAKLVRKGDVSEELLADRLIDQFDNKTMVKQVVAETMMKLNGLDPETHHQNQLGKFMSHWNKLEKAIQAALRTRGYKAYNSAVTWRLVVEEYALTGLIREAYHRLRLERNKIVHGYVPTTAAGFDRLNAEVDRLLELLNLEYGV